MDTSRRHQALPDKQTVSGTPLAEGKVAVFAQSAGKRAGKGRRHMLNDQNGRVEIMRQFWEYLHKSAGPSGRNPDHHRNPGRAGERYR